MLNLPSTRNRLVSRGMQAMPVISRIYIYTSVYYRTTTKGLVGCEAQPRFVLRWWGAHTVQPWSPHLPCGNSASPAQGGWDGKESKAGVVLPLVEALAVKPRVVWCAPSRQEWRVHLSVGFIQYPWREELEGSRPFRSPAPIRTSAAFASMSAPAVLTRFLIGPGRLRSSAATFGS